MPIYYRDMNSMIIGMRKIIMKKDAAAEDVDNTRRQSLELPEEHLVFTFTLGGLYINKWLMLPK